MKNGVVLLIIVKLKLQHVLVIQITHVVIVVMFLTQTVLVIGVLKIMIGAVSSRLARA